MRSYLVIHNARPMMPLEARSRSRRSAPTLSAREVSVTGAPRVTYAPIAASARRVLLDALEALAQHRDGCVLVGAQAVYLCAGDSARCYVAMA